MSVALGSSLSIPTQRLDPPLSLVEDCVGIALDLIPVLFDVSLYPYETLLAERIFYSLLAGDGAEITGLFSRQSGKSETAADAVATSMVLMPRLAKLYPQYFGKFLKGLWVGTFGPVREQSETIFARIVDRLTSEHAKEALADPEINESVKPIGNRVLLPNCQSFCRRQTAHPKAKIESKTYHLVVIDEAQDANRDVVRRSIHPMLASTNGTIVKLGTPSYEKGEFYDAIQRNKREEAAAKRSRKGARTHFEFDYRTCSKYNPDYAKYVEKEKRSLGEDSDEFRLAYKLEWLLERGMFVTQEDMERLADPTMGIVPHWTSTPVVVGIDPARRVDSTVVTVLWVDWDQPDEFRMFNTRVLNWLELNGEWESQYFQICDFLSHYYVAHISVDAQGMGGPVGERLKVLLPPTIEISLENSNPPDISERYKWLIQHLDRGLVGWPGSREARKSRQHKRFVQQMMDAEKHYRGKYIAVEAPKERNAHDDYVSSLALAVWGTKTYAQETEQIEVSENFFYAR